MSDTTPDDAIAAWLTTPDLAELRRLLDCASELPWEYYRPHYASGYHSITDSGGQLVAIEADEYDAELIAAATNALPALLDAAAFLDEVRAQVTRGALCPMCSTGMTRQTVGMVCQLCGTDYGRPEYASLRRDSEQTTKAALAEALAVRAERDALAAKVERVRALALNQSGPGRWARDEGWAAFVPAADLLRALDEEPQP